MGIEQFCTCLCQPSGVLSCRQNLGENLPQLPRIAVRLCKRVKLRQHMCIEVLLLVVNREHSRSVSDSQHPLSGEQKVHISRQSRQLRNLSNVRLMIQNCLI